MGTNGGRANGLVGFRRGGERGRLAGISGDRGLRAVQWNQRGWENKGNILFQNQIATRDQQQLPLSSGSVGGVYIYSLDLY